MRPSCRDEFAIAIICALTLEAEAVEELFDETYDRLSRIYKKQPGDDNAYVNGRIGMHNVVLCYMPGMGIGSAASVASSLKVSYTRIQVALVIGICGGAPYTSTGEEIFLGDVIMSDAVVEYDFGRQYPGGFQRKTDIKETLGRPNREIRTLLAGLKASRSRREFQDKMLQYLHTIQLSEAKWRRPAFMDDVLFEASYQHKHYESTSSSQCLCFTGSSSDDICKEALKTICSSLGCDEKQIRRHRHYTEINNTAVHIGTIASANTVMKSGEHRESLVKSERVIGFEMEGAGVWDNIPCVIVKGVCDYADSHKNKSWQAYAAATGASAAKAFLEYWRPDATEDKKLETQYHWMVPFRKNPRFVGREKEISEIEELITKQDGPAKVSICGLGGVGKTQITLELAYRMRGRYSIFWIPCTSHESVEQAYMSIAQLVGIHDVKPGDAKERVKAYLSQTSVGKWLLIFDNADDMDMWVQSSVSVLVLTDFLPQSEKGHILFTTRNGKLAVKLASSFVIPISEPDMETGLKILEESLIKKDLLNDTDIAITLLNQLALLPLAISQAAAFINENGIRLSEYTALLLEQEPDVIELLSEDFGDEGRYKDMQNPVATTWWISFQQIQQLNGTAIDYLSFMACINPRAIPQSLLPPATSRKKRVEAIGLLKAFAFISDEGRDCSLNLHRLVHLATRNWMRKNQQFHLQILKTTDRLNEAFPNNDHTSRKLWRDYLPHALSLIGENEFQRKQKKYVGFIQKIGNCLYSDGRYTEAEVLYAQVMQVRKQKLGSEHPHTLTSMNNLARTYRGQGRWKEAEELDVQVMEICKQKLGSEHPNMLVSMGNLASTYRNQGRWKEAEELDVQVMEICKQKLGSEHPDTLSSMGNLASTYWKQGRWKKAEELNMQVMEICKQKLGSEHPDTLCSMNNLASTYGKQGRWKKAEELNMQVMEICKQKLGSEHPHTLTSMGNLASTYRNQGRWKEAEELDVQVMEICKQKLGSEHPDTLSSMGNLASTYWNQGRWKEAEELNVQVMEIRKQKLGSEHPDTLCSMNNLASTYGKQGRWKKAEELNMQVMEIRKQKLGSEHPDTLSSMGSLACTYRDQERWKEAEELFVQVMEIRNQKLGSEHPDTLSSMGSLACTYRDQGRWKEAEELFVQVMEIRNQKLGSEHPHTLTSMNNLASTYRNQGRWKEAEELFVQVMEIRKQKLGSEHPHTLTSMNKLACTYRDQGRWKEAEELFVQVMEIRKQKLGSEHPHTLT